MRMAARNVTTISGPFGMVTATRSPGLSPAAQSARAVASTSVASCE
jgi:hypothetical protein